MHELNVIIWGMINYLFAVDKIFQKMKLYFSCKEILEKRILFKMLIIKTIN